MILTCPECATSYFVDDSRISRAGRTVKCSNCGARWMARPEGGAATPPPEPRPQPAPIEYGALADDLVVEEATPEPAPFKFKPAAPAKRDARGKVAIWGISAAVIVAMIAGAIAFRVEVVRWLPASQAAYAGLGMPVSSLVIEKVHAEPAFQGGRAVLAVTGQIRNTRPAAATVPALRVSLLDRAGKPLAVKVARPINALEPAGAVRHFAIAIIDPPAGVHDLEVTFEAAGAQPAPPRPAEAVAGGPEPAEARPLPPGSPDALPPHE